ncbi:Tuberous sclerosis 2-like protein, partial [Quaeritorhiza haematococci]
MQAIKLGLRKRLEGGGNGVASTSLSTPLGGSVDVQSLLNAIDTLHQNDAPLNSKITAVNQLADLVRVFSFPEELDTLWISIRPLTHPQFGSDACGAVLEFMRACLEVQYDSVDELRLSLYLTLEEIAKRSKECLVDTLPMLLLLTKEGRDLRCIEREFCPFLASQLEELASAYPKHRPSSSTSTGGAPAVVSSANTTSPTTTTTVSECLKLFLPFAIKVVKFSFIHLDKQHCASLVRSACILCQKSTDLDLLTDCLLMFDAIGRYGSSLPSSELRLSLETLCGTVNIEELATLSWQIMRNVFKSHRVRHAFNLLFDILDGEEEEKGGGDMRGQEKKQEVENPSPFVLRGAVFFVSMATWGSQRLSKIFYPATYVLSHLRVAAKRHMESVDCEILLAVKALIKARGGGKDLTVLEWDIVIEILDSMIRYWLVQIESGEGGKDLRRWESWKLGEEKKNEVGMDAHGGESSTNFATILSLCSEILLAVKNTLMLGESVGLSISFIDMLVDVGPRLASSLALILIDQCEAHSWHSAFGEWLPKIVETFFLKETRREIRCRVVQFVLDSFQIAHVEERNDLFEMGVAPLCRNLWQEKDAVVFGMVLRLILAIFGECSDMQVEALVECLVATIQRGARGAAKTQGSVPSASSSGGGGEVGDASVVLPILLLIRMFVVCTVDLSGRCCILLFSSLLKILASQSVPKNAKWIVLDYLTCLRADAYHRIQVPKFDAKAEAFQTDEGFASMPTFPQFASVPPPGSLSVFAEVPLVLCHHVLCWSPTSQPHSSSKEQGEGDDHRTTEAALEAAMVASRKEGEKPKSEHQSTTGTRPLFSSTSSSSEQQQQHRQHHQHTHQQQYGGDHHHHAHNTKPLVLSVDEYLQSVIRIIVAEKQWALYWHALRRLPSQLENFNLFRGCERQIQALRSLICDMILGETAASNIVDFPSSTIASTGTAATSPSRQVASGGASGGSSSGGIVKKSDIYLVAYRILTRLFAYRQWFMKSQQDEIIVTLQVGLHRWPASVTAKYCVHALTLALFELPASMTRLLPSTLMKVSQITSSAMSVSNLEFLSTLARLPGLFVNFTDADFKRVFGIALQYIRFSGHSSSTPAAALIAQYVVHLAYHVVSIWFTSMRLTERRKYVSFIIHYLLLGMRGGGGGGAGGSGGTGPLATGGPGNRNAAQQQQQQQQQEMDENVEMVLDMLVHNCFVDCYPKPPDDTKQMEILSMAAAATASSHPNQEEQQQQPSIPPSKAKPASTVTGSTGGSGEKQVGRTWVQGHSIISIKMLQTQPHAHQFSLNPQLQLHQQPPTHGQWIEIHVRRPSGALHFYMRLENR